MFRKTAKQILLDLHDALNEEGIEHFLFFGTLLGAYRNNDFLSADIDIVCNYSDYYKFLELFKNKEDWEINKIWPKEIALFKYGRKIDIFFADVNEEETYLYINKKNSFTKRWDTEQRYIWKTKDIFPLETRNFMGSDFLIPCNPKNCFVPYYGINWNKPNKDWNRDDFPPDNLDKDYRQIAIIVPDLTEEKREEIYSVFPEDWVRLYEYWTFFETEPFIFFSQRDTIFDKNLQLNKLIDILCENNNADLLSTNSPEECDLETTKTKSGKQLKFSKQKLVQISQIGGCMLRNHGHKLLREEVLLTNEVTITKKKTDLISDVGVIIINFLRPQTTRDCIDSLLNVCPSIKIYLGDQDNNDNGLQEYSKEKGINYIPLDFDCGIGIARNKLVDEIIKDGCKYLMWCDNDFIFNEEFKLDNAITILENRDDIGVVGGSLLINGKLGHYEKIMLWDRKRNIAAFIPLNSTYPEPIYTNNVEHYDCDLVYNFCLAKTELFINNLKVRWSEKIKVRFEHSYWFFKLMEHTNVKVSYCPSMQAIHRHVGNTEYDNFRKRDDDSDRFYEETGLKVNFSWGEHAWDYKTGKVFKEPKYVKPVKKEIEGQTPYHPVLEKTLNSSSTANVKPQISERHIGILNDLKNNNIKILLLKDSCYEIVKKQTLNGDLYLHLDRKALGVLQKIGYTINKSTIEKDGVSIFYTKEPVSRTKPYISLGSYDFNIPAPVKPYFKKCGYGDII